jgi:hypothetical protein
MMNLTQRASGAEKKQGENWLKMVSEQSIRTFGCRVERDLASVINATV